LNETIKRTASVARVILEASDPEGDDVGIIQGSRYSYPRNPAFLPGSFDIRSLRVQCDAENLYFHLQFSSLSDPGWHPEYGFQLTFVAIAVETGNMPGSGTAEIPANAAVALPSGHAYDRLILVGGGVRVEDERGKILAAYLPVPDDVGNPLGDAENGTIDFALPLSIVGTPKPGWHFTVYSGGQDDHGGAGLGEFRTVNRTAGEWNGGGRLRPEDPNVFDVLEATSR
jgi:carbohydrate-binding DOMON domain-containing protein